MPTSHPSAEFRSSEAVRLVGTMRVYDSQTDVSSGIPAQQHEFLSLPLPSLEQATMMYGASPCTPDGKIHYLSGIAFDSTDAPLALDTVMLAAGEYAVFTVDDMADLRRTWAWVLREWLPASGRQERNAPEFERFLKRPGSTEVSAPVELWIPLEAQPKTTR